MPQLLSNASATGAAVQWGGGMGVFTASGTWAGATVTLQYLSPNGSTYVAMGTDTTLSADGGGVFFYPPGLIRAAVSGGPPSAMYAQAEQIK